MHARLVARFLKEHNLRPVDAFPNEEFHGRCVSRPGIFGQGREFATVT